MKKTTIGVFSDKLEVTKIIKELIDSGISDSEISCIYTDKEGIMHDTQTDEKMEHSGMVGAGTGAMIGALAGVIVASGVIPGLGTIFVAGPLIEILGIGITGAVATTAFGAGAGAIILGVGSALMEYGVDEEDAFFYEESVKKGEILLITKTEIETAKDIMLKNKVIKVEIIQ